MSQVFGPDRISWDDYFMNIAKAVALRADCRRARHGAVIVKDRRIVSTGYNGSPPGGPSCLKGECPRGLLDHTQQPSGAGGSGQDYSNCVAQHAEGNAIAFASWLETQGATIYITGTPCIGCWKNIQSAGITKVVTPDAYYDAVPEMRLPYQSGSYPR